ncbi:MAG: hypothetical protein IJJ26_10665 [Victivallales bacterium]|nr:hypothetical protein [Victivallales bacterium]
MKIYRFWCTKQVTLTDAVGETFEQNITAGSEFSQADAEARIPMLQAALNRKIQTGQCEAEVDGYEVPIREEIIQELDPHNVVTRNRYGALVLNSTDHCIVDVDLPPHAEEPPSLWTSFFSFQWLFGRAALSGEPAPTPLENARKQLLEDTLTRLRSSAFQGLSFRVYRTAHGLRVFARGRELPVRTDFTNYLFEQLHADPLYAKLCEKQNCYRARLTPKPWRVNVKSPQFRFPYDSEAQRAMQGWLREYENARRMCATCSLVAEVGSPVYSSVIEYHDRVCRVREGGLEFG